MTTSPPPPTTTTSSTSNKPHIVALTGGIGSGKSTVAMLLAEAGAAVVEADQLAREVVAPGTVGLQKIAEAFGSSYVSTDGSLDRKNLARLIFSDNTARKTVESILHPLIRTQWLSQLSSLQALGQHELIVYAVPLLFESGQSYPEIDTILLVVSPETERVARIIARDKISLTEAQQRINAQLSDEEKIKRSDLVLVNDCPLPELRSRVQTIVTSLLRADPKAPPPAGH